MTTSDDFTFGVALKTLPTEGNLVYEYNPFYNYRLDHTMILYKKRLMEIDEFCKDIGLTREEFDAKAEKNDWYELIPKTESPPIVCQAGLLTNFETDELKFDLHNPVNITPQYSYDNSVNLIINDGKNPPRLINSRFSATERNKYLVCNRKGNNDSNIYDLGEQFNIDTSLYKKINTIPQLEFLGVRYGGNLSIGNYHFYFRYVDEDGNESDFFAESGLVSIFIGNSADSIYSGFRDETSHKLVRFLLSNTDPGYSKVSIYYTKSSSDIFLNATTLAKRILQNYRLNDNGNTVLTISGFELTFDIPVEDINIQYLVYGSAETLATALNMLFLGNVDRPKIPYEDLADCALRFLPVLDVNEKYDINLIKTDYTGKVNNTYYDPNYIYHKVGYWDDEIYRFGIVFIQSDNTLTEVFNVRGGKLKVLEEGEDIYDQYTLVNFYKEDEKKKEEGEKVEEKHLIRLYISYDELYYNIIGEDGSTNLKKNSDNLENAKGVVLIQHPTFDTVIGLNFKVSEEVIKYLRDTLKIKGFFFVRLKRIPTTLCQAYTIGVDKESHTPVLPVGDKFITESFLSQKEESDRVDNDGRPADGMASTIARRNDTKGSKLLTHDFDKRKYTLENLLVAVLAAICPDYDVNFPYLNTLFSASELVCRNCKNEITLSSEENTDIHFYPGKDLKLSTFDKSDSYTNIKVVGVEDNTKLVAINNNMFSARAGEAEEAFRFEYIGKKNVNKDATNLIRGSYGPFLGIVGYENKGNLIDIKIPGYNPALMAEYFRIRYEDKSPYYAISDRYGFANMSEWSLDEIVEEEVVEEGKKKTIEQKYYSMSKPLYRGDCYICLFTHRLNRNFLDPSSPTNDNIVDPKCWKENFDVTDGVVKKENFEKINLGDVNAIQLGMYITLIVRSTMNLNIRALDDSIPDETALFGHPRGFYPYSPMTCRGAYKTPEALCYNKGFEKSVSERLNFEVPDVPWIKNEFSNRIAYSNIQVLDAFLNGWRTFIGTHYRDYPKTYGSITKLVELRGNLLCVFEHGVALIAVNERAVAGEGSGGNVFINTSNVLPLNPKVISDTFGSLWRDSVIKTPRGVYGVDTIGKKIWRTNGETFECISDFRIQEFLNQNISLTERELLPVIGVRNVKAHYNKFKGDVMFTFYDNLHGFEEKVWNVCFNESLLKWITFYSWVPSYSENIYNQYFSFDRNTSKWITKLGISKHGNLFSDGVTLEDNTIKLKTGLSTTLHLDNRNLPELSNITHSIEYELIRDNLGNNKLFSLNGDNLTFTGLYKNIMAEFYARTVEIEFQGEPTTEIGVYTLDGKAKQIYILTDPKSAKHKAPYIETPKLEKYLPIKFIRYRHYSVKYNWYTYRYYYMEDGIQKYIDSDTDPTNIVWTSKSRITLATLLNSRGDHLYEIISVSERPADFMNRMTNTPENPYLLEDLYTYLNKDINKDFWEVEVKIFYWTQNEIYVKYSDKLGIYKDDYGRRIWLPKDKLINGDRVVLLLNIRAHVKVTYKGADPTLGDAYANNYNSGILTDGGYYDSVVAVIPEYNKLFLTTDFWKHGLAGIIDIADKIYPTYWYGKQHPFEFEFVVADKPLFHKIFDDLEIISNKADPESFHYEIVGECYDFAKDKKNMYIRLEATKELYQNNGFDVLYNHDYANLMSEHRELRNSKGLRVGDMFDKSTLFPLYYSRRDTINEIEDAYHLKDNIPTKDFSALAGAEIVRYENLDEYRIWNHAKAIDLLNSGRMRGNMQYKEDRWNVLINPINLVEKNENEWVDLDGNWTSKVPVELGQSPIPNEVLVNPDGTPKSDLIIPDSFKATSTLEGRGYVIWKWEESQNKEVKLKDKFIKVRIRYSGEDLAIISAIRTLYSISYS